MARDEYPAVIGPRGVPTPIRCAMQAGTVLKNLQDLISLIDISIRRKLLTADEWRDMIGWLHELEQWAGSEYDRLRGM